MARKLRSHVDEPPVNDALFHEVADHSYSIPTTSELEPLYGRIGDSRFVLLGEATHGTREFYTWRAQISRHLIENKGFSFIGVEADWPDCEHVNRFVKGEDDGRQSVYDVLRTFDRWPTWMWANEEMASFLTWLREFNTGLRIEDKVGFYGLDIYSLWDSLHRLRTLLETVAPDTVNDVLHTLACFEPYGANAQSYARATALEMASCEADVTQLVETLRREPLLKLSPSSDEALQIEQNAAVLQNAERYYRHMAKTGPQAWNIRDRHMAQTLARIVQHVQSTAGHPQPKGLVWAHNTHIGDARFTDMIEDGLVNLGQLAREHYGPENVTLVGFGTHRGEVVAGREWEAPMETMSLPPARSGSWEDLLFRLGGTNKLLTFREAEPAHAMLEPRGQRAVGVVYRPRFDAFGNYVPTVLPRRYDGFVFLDETEALQPLGLAGRKERDVPETFPSAV